MPKIVGRGRLPCISRRVTVSHQRERDEIKLLRVSLSDLLNVIDRWPLNYCKAVEHALLNVHEFAERLVTLGTTGANAVGNLGKHNDRFDGVRTAHGTTRLIDRR